ncbi:MAG TPA: chemotaxis response regulator protein-glutamate methylesterase [Dongiaceae bacterium]|jgi:two-component system chemotaxis response regulator CheB|nr:chemotaxis response regulator protein-glutamate methylesterase [Dongiaceae bacterium]
MTIPAVSPRASEAPYGVMLVEDSHTIRAVLRRALENDPRIRVVAEAVHGKQAVEEIHKYSVDIVILDIEMPVMDGLTALPKLLAAKPGIQVIIASALTQKGAQISIRALALGAADYISKPIAGSLGPDFAHDLVDKVKTLGAAARHKQKLRPVSAAPAAPLAAPRKALRAECLAIGCSTGGPVALPIFLKQLGSRCTYPVFITQHMPSTFTAMLAEHLQEVSGIPAAEGRDGEFVSGGRLYVAPGNYHMIVHEEGGRKVIRLNQNPPENFCRPSVDPMMRSIASVYRGNAVAVILTGMGRDGTEGVRALLQAGGMAFAQDEQSSVVWGMPGSLVHAGLAHAVLPLSKLGETAQKYLPG